MRRKQELRAIMVCVEYSDILNITLPYNRHHFKEVLIVTTPWDSATHQVAKRCDAGLFFTDSFYANGASFNKWLALEQGLDSFGRKGLMCLMDADILWPKSIDHPKYQEHYLYSPVRYLQIEPNASIVPSDLWSSLPKFNDIEHAGYTQIFHATDRHLPVPPPWHQTNWRHAGGADTFFQQCWPASHKLRPTWPVLHLGLPQRNWAGRSTDYLDGTCHSLAAQRAENLRTMMSSRTSPSNSGGDPYRQERIIK